MLWMPYVVHQTRGIVASKKTGTKIAKRSGTKARKTANPVNLTPVADHGNRGTVWPPAWERLAAAYGKTYEAFAAEDVGVSYNTLYRWAVTGAPIPDIAVKLIGMLAAMKSLPNPATGRHLIA